MGSTQDTQDAQNSLRLMQWVCACCAHRSRIIDQWLKNWQRLGTPVTRATRDHPQTYPVIIISVIPYHATSCPSLGIIWVPLLPPLLCWASPASQVTWTARCLVKTATGITAQQPASHRRSTESSSGGGAHHCKLPHSGPCDSDWPGPQMHRLPRQLMYHLWCLLNACSAKWWPLNEPKMIIQNRIIWRIRWFSWSFLLGCGCPPLHQLNRVQVLRVSLNRIDTLKSSSNKCHVCSLETFFKKWPVMYCPPNQVHNQPQNLNASVIWSKSSSRAVHIPKLNRPVSFGVKNHAHQPDLRFL